MAKRIQKITLDGLTQRTLNFGYTGENEHTQIRINCAAIFWDYPDAEYSMVVQPPVGDLYNVTLTKDGAYLVWDVTLDDLMYSGGGQFQLTFTDSGEVIKSTIGSYNINRSLEAFGEGNVPSPLEQWKESIEARLTALEEQIG